MRLRHVAVLALGRRSRSAPARRSEPAAWPRRPPADSAAMRAPREQARADSIAAAERPRREAEERERARAGRDGPRARDAHRHRVLRVRQRRADRRGAGEAAHEGGDPAGEPVAAAARRGHADERGSTEYNLALGQRRAESVKNFVIGLRDRRRPHRAPSATARSARRWRATRESAWSRNRRAEFAMTGGEISTVAGRGAVMKRAPPRARSSPLAAAGRLRHQARPAGPAARRSRLCASPRRRMLRELQRQNATILDSLSHPGRPPARRPAATSWCRSSGSCVQMQELTGQGQQRLAELRQELQAARGGAARARTPPAAAPGARAAGNPEELFATAQAALQRGSLRHGAGGLRGVRARPSRSTRGRPRRSSASARAYEKAKDPAKALEAYQRVLELYPNSPQAPTALYRAALMEIGARATRDRARAMLNQMRPPTRRARRPRGQGRALRRS